MITAWKKLLSNILEKLQLTQQLIHTQTGNVNVITNGSDHMGDIELPLEHLQKNDGIEICSVEK